MKVLVEISDDQIVAALKESVERCLKACLPIKLPMQRHHAADLFAAVEYGNAANKVIEHWGGTPVDLTALTSC